MAPRDRKPLSSLAPLTFLVLAAACGGSTTTSPSSTTSGASTTAGATGTGGGGAGATSTATAAGGFGGWGSGGGCPAAAVASPFGDPAGACATCMATSCGSLVAVCFGPGWTSGRYAGSCADFQRCLCMCLAGGGGEDACASSCAPRITADCKDCSPVLSNCQKQSCAAECGG